MMRPIAIVLETGVIYTKKMLNTILICRVKPTCEKTFEICGRCIKVFVLNITAKKKN